MLSKDKLTGWPTKEDPNPGTRQAATTALTGWPTPPGETPATLPEGHNPDLERRLRAVNAAKVKAQRAATLKRACEAYEVEAPISLKERGKTVLFLRSCKVGDCARSSFPDAEAVIHHLIDVHGTAARDQRYREMQEAAAVAATTDEDDEPVDPELPEPDPDDA